MLNQGNIHFFRKTHKIDWLHFIIELFNRWNALNKIKYARRQPAPSNNVWIGYQFPNKNRFENSCESFIDIEVHLVQSTMPIIATHTSISLLMRKCACYMYKVDATNHRQLCFIRIIMVRTVYGYMHKSIGCRIRLIIVCSN